MKKKFEGNLNWNEEDEKFYNRAEKIVIKEKNVSASLLQRKLKIGYACSARLLDVLEERGIISKFQYPKGRIVLTPKK